MVYTVPAGQLIVDSLYTVRFTLEDFMTERIRKVTKLSNFGAAANLQAAMRVFESVTNAGLVKATGSIDLDITGQKIAATEAGEHFAVVKEILYISFEKPHPLDATQTITATFGIPAPKDAIVNQTPGNIGKPIMVRGISFAAAAGLTEALGALVDWLEDAITYRTFGTTYVGGWTYADSRSGLASVAGIIDGSDLT